MSCHLIDPPSNQSPTSNIPTWFHNPGLDLSRCSTSTLSRSPKISEAQLHRFNALLKTHSQSPCEITYQAWLPGHIADPNPMPTRPDPILRPSNPTCVSFHYFWYSQDRHLITIWKSFNSTIWQSNIPIIPKSSSDNIQMIISPSTMTDGQDENHYYCFPRRRSYHTVA